MITRTPPRLPADPNSPGAIDLRNATAAFEACRLANHGEATAMDHIAAAAACNKAAETSIGEGWRRYWLQRAESHSYTMGLIRELESLDGRTPDADGTFLMNRCGECDDTKEVIGSFGESMVPCPACCLVAA